MNFQREGDQAPNKIPADIVFIIKDKPHPHFRREGSDLKYTCRLTLKEVGQFFYYLTQTLFYVDKKALQFEIRAALKVLLNTHFNEAQCKSHRNKS